ncbi:putative membrane protein YqiK [Roseimicrobium gellanilyticum]|uniref:Putative membrane protein YqiK n=1 Tax=Roseimicrobium gellanilyticum TaxID=748857 RepID=A0A366H6K0_9BACT|nr:SPFH domain-containing protein [Roseimicrobium gellanilyticum]RBP37748.1 putative membrane protein YqiK [Roseimicrobium gellanilyticum]
MNTLALAFSSPVWWPLIPATLVFLYLLLGVVYIGERQVGIVVKRFGMRNLPPGQIIALRGEAGIQADTLTPGLHFFYWVWQYSITRTGLIEVPQDHIALVVAIAGEPIPAGRILGRNVPCNHFQDAREFLTGGGEKGRQNAILTAGTYRINTALFDIITPWNATQRGINPSSLRIYKVEQDLVGIVTTLDGAPIDEGEIAGTLVPGHDNFQDAQSFLDHGGRRGLQEQVLLSGQWNLNPWFAEIEQVHMVEIPIGHVGVVISFVGKAHEDVSGVDFKHGDLVLVGHKGVWVTPLLPGKHPINTRVARVELVPTTNIVLNWATRTEAHAYDAKLNSITVRSRDGFAFNLDVSQIIHIGANEAPRVISRAGSLQNLVDHVLQPLVGNYFRNSAQDYTVLDFLSARSHRQEEAASHIEVALREYDVEAIDTLIGDITPPEALMKTQTDRKIAEEQRKTYEVQEAAETQRQQLVRQTSLADIQQQVVGAEQGVQIAELHARATVRQSEGEAESTRLRAGGESDAIRATGQAKAEAYRVGVDALGSQNYALIQLMQIIGERNVQVVPDVAVTGAQGANGLMDALMALMVRRDVEAAETRKILHN